MTDNGGYYPATCPTVHNGLMAYPAGATTNGAFRPDGAVRPDFGKTLAEPTFACSTCGRRAGGTHSAPRQAILTLGTARKLLLRRCKRPLFCIYVL